MASSHVIGLGSLSGVCAGRAQEEMAETQQVSAVTRLVTQGVPLGSPWGGTLKSKEAILNQQVGGVV